LEKDKKLLLGEMIYNVKTCNQIKTTIRASFEKLKSVYLVEILDMVVETLVYHGKI
jgi:hypothetical protein